ncbi:nucleoside triphosphate pyrophosphohydrolase [uncultured Clostridium sp.]|uniref:nucleoside triphosphate pyrophosphohydrolase n=1 Tax=uncultured Clostridium sp. TaxID=59620 RepID=UPI0026044A5C|nr:nucleoside triphosphate pyrophosphohydrolase [uncultured Clostridium sp.]
MKKYDKLVRDLIPEIIEKTGKTSKTRIVSGKEKTKYLETKLEEEVGEYLEDKNLEELADVMEVLFALADNLGYTEKDLLEKREEKKQARGGFKEGIILEEVR